MIEMSILLFTGLLPGGQKIAKRYPPPDLIGVYINLNLRDHFIEAIGQKNEAIGPKIVRVLDPGREYSLVECHKRYTSHRK